MAAAQVPDPRQPSPQAPGGARQGGWTAGRIIVVVVGSILVLCSVGLLGGSGAALWAQTSLHHPEPVLSVCPVAVVRCGS